MFMWFMTMFEWSYLNGFNEVTCKHCFLQYDLLCFIKLIFLKGVVDLPGNTVFEKSFYKFLIYLSVSTFWFFFYLRGNYDPLRIQVHRDFLHKMPSRASPVLINVRVVSSLENTLLIFCFHTRALLAFLSLLYFKVFLAHGCRGLNTKDKFG